MTAYDPDSQPDAAEWLGCDESQRIDLVAAYHRRHQMSGPRLRLHAAIHAVVENQIALGESVVVDTVGRLQDEGLTRHEAIHAIGTVVAEHVAGLLTPGPKPPEGGTAEYFEKLKSLTAAEWRKSG